MPLFDPSLGEVVYEPEKGEAGYWVGAPSVWVEGKGIYLSTRHRRPLDQDRGWKSAISYSEDGINFEEIWSVQANTLNTESIERSALVRDPGGVWRLYISYVDLNRRWRIDLLEAEDVMALDPDKRIKIMDAESTLSEGVKDPYVMFISGMTYMFVAYAPIDTVVPGSTYDDLHGTGNVFTTGLVQHPSGLWISADGRNFTFKRDITVPGYGWDRNVARLSCVVPNGVGFTIFYDGRLTSGDVYEDKTGMCSTLDFVNVIKHSDEGAILEGPYGSGCLRYIDCVRFEDDLLYYYEVSRVDAAHELRVAKVPLTTSG